MTKPHIDDAFLPSLRRAMQSLGVEPELIEQIIPAVVAEWGGDRPYIPVNGEQRPNERSARDAAIIRDYRRGERVALLVRRYRLSRQRVYQIIAGAV